MAHHYSTTEQVVSTWIDDKPVYEITIVDDSPSLNGYSIDITNLNVDKLIALDGVFTRIVGNVVQYYPHNIYENGDNYEFVRINARDGVANGNLFVNIHYGATSKAIFILRYTKTTD